MPEAFIIVYALEAVSDIRQLRAFDRSKVVDGIKLFLEHSPTKVSKSRIKKMTQPYWSQYRLRIDDFRVYYDVDELRREVSVLRVLEKTKESSPEFNP